LHNEARVEVVEGQGGGPAQAVGVVGKVKQVLPLVGGMDNTNPEKIVDLLFL
jgi:hypothetical protein